MTENIATQKCRLLYNINFSGKVVTFQESLFACKRKLSKTSRLLRRAANYWQLPRSSGLGDRSSDDCDHV